MCCVLKQSALWLPPSLSNSGGYICLEFIYMNKHDINKTDEAYNVQLKGIELIFFQKYMQ